MNRGFIKILLAVGLGMIIGGAVAWKMNQKPNTLTQWSACSIDASSLNTGSATPTITGTYNGDSAVGIVIVKEVQTLPRSGNFSNLPGSVVVSYSDHGGDVEIDSFGPESGKFSLTSPPLQSGTYTVGIYVFHNIYTDEGFQGDSTPMLIASDTLIVH